MPPLWDAIARERADRTAAKPSGAARKRTRRRSRADRRAGKAETSTVRAADRRARAERWAGRLASGWVFWPACLVGTALVAMGVLGPDAARHIDMERRCAAMQAEVQAIETAQRGLEAERDALRTDPAYTEQVIRAELGIVRPGEIPVPLPQEIGPPTPPAPPPLAAELEQALEVLEPLNQPSARLATLLSGGLLVAAALLLSVPNNPSLRSL